MILSEVIALIMVPVAIFYSVTTLFIGIGFGTKKNRIETIRVIKSWDLGASKISGCAELWSFYFVTFFGKKLLSKRQAFAIPLFTVLVSIVFFALWVVYIYLFQNNSGDFFANLPLPLKQAFHDFYTKGIFPTLLIVFLTVLLSKKSIKEGNKHGYKSYRFLFLFILTLIIQYFLFSLTVFVFRLDDMVRLYMEYAPNDPMPVMPYEPFGNMSSSLKLFYPPTVIHVTSQGWISTYFMPEPLMFYCSTTSSFSLFGIFILYYTAWVLEKIKKACVKLATNIGTPETNAKSILVFLIVSVIAFFAIILAFIDFASSV